MQTVLELPSTQFGQVNVTENILEKRAIFYAFEDCRHAVFFDVSWEILQEIIEKYNGIRNPRIFYKKGILEIMPVSPEHDIPERIVDSIIDELCDEMELDFVNYGSTTQARERIKGAFEPDSSFYFGEKAAFMRSRNRVLETDPLPDLVFEADITHSSTYRDDLLAELGVAEIWRYQKKQMKILCLENGEYRESETSRIFPNFTALILMGFVAESRQLNRSEWRTIVREWARENLKK